MILALLSVTDCHATVSPNASVSNSSNPSRTFPSAVARDGEAACELSAGVFGPTTYLVSEIGKRGEPRVGDRDAAKARKIATYVRHPKTLRFGYVSGKFIVIDATSGVCGNGLPYRVLNMFCNVIYMPVDRPYELSASTGGCGGGFNTPITPSMR